MRDVSHSAERFLSELGSRRRRRVPLRELQLTLVRAEPVMATSPDRRRRLAELLRELEAAGEVSVPMQWSDRSERPPLPSYATVNGERPAPWRARRGADFPWLRELAWAAGLQLSDEDFDLLKRVNRFLRDGGAHHEVVHIRERSLELLGDDKALERRLGHVIFGPDRLSLELLRCGKAAPPFYWERTGTGPDLLILENHPAFWSLRQAMPGDANVGRVAYGGGDLFKASVFHIAALEPRPGRVLYFGDIDQKGLEIAIAATAITRREGLPEVEPAEPLYRLLVRNPIIQATAERVTAEKAANLALFLPEPLRPQVVEALVAGQRIVQENLGLERLRSEVEMLRSL